MMIMRKQFPEIIFLNYEKKKSDLDFLMKKWEKLSLS